MNYNFFLGLNIGMLFFFITNKFVEVGNVIFVKSFSHGPLAKQGDVVRESQFFFNIFFQGTTKNWRGFVYNSERKAQALAPVSTVQVYTRQFTSTSVQLDQPMCVHYNWAKQSVCTLPSTELR